MENEGQEKAQELAKQLDKKESHPLVKVGFTFLPQTWNELYNYAKEISQTEFVPDQMRNKPAAVLACWQKGHEVGLPPMASLQNIAIINGRPSIHSGGYWSLVVGHPLCEWTEELSSEEALKAGYGECTVKRRGAPHAKTRRFTIEMAKTAGLWGGTGDSQEKREKSVWFKYPGRMLQMRARHLAGDDAIPEAAQGLIPSDIAEELEPRDVTPLEEPKDKKPRLEQLKDTLKAEVSPKPEPAKEPDQPDPKQEEPEQGPTPMQLLINDINSLSTPTGIREMASQFNKRLKTARVTQPEDIVKVSSVFNAKRAEIFGSAELPKG